MNDVLKRLFDLAAASIAALVFLPVMVAIAMAIRLDSPGPVLFKQVRIGRGGRPFRIFKFRTMVANASELSANVSPADDPRVTRAGSFLRRTYLDELPQLFNVIAGAMSLVGPRPETPEFVEHYTDEERALLSVRPGLAGPSTLEHMDEAKVLAAVGDPERYYIETMLHDRARLDLDYVRAHSVGGDIAILLRQVVAIFGGR
jgi:lipopolysaccharide/colanic/teichoic acid biosynthesis glycosyltransferase